MLELLRDRHRELDEITASVVRDVTNLAATMEVLDSVDDAAVREAFESSERTFEALESFLETLAEATDAEDGPPDAKLGAVVRQLEPPPGPAGTGRASDAPDPDREDGGESSDPFENVTPLRRLSAPYSVLLNLERDLYTDRVRRPFRLKRLKELWGDLSRAGSPHPTDGLVARLGRLSESFDPDSDSIPSDPPWSVSSRETLADLADRAGRLADLDDEEIRRRARESWIGRVENWVETAEEEPGTVAELEEMFTRFLTDLPREQTPEVRMLLERMLELEELPEALRNRTERILDRD